MNKTGIVKLGKKLGVDFSFTHSCYDPDENGKPCFECDSCILREKGFKNAGIADPARQKWKKRTKM
jgi:7-cyano-7-deazaguanine synthase